MAKESNPKNNQYLPQVYPDPFQSVTMNPDAINNFIDGLGIRFMHFQAIPDPLFKRSEDSPRHSFNQEDSYMFEKTNVYTRENGFLYFPKAVVVGIFMSNSKNLQSSSAGLHNFSTASISFNRYYEGTTEVVEISEYDKLIPCENGVEFFTTSWQSLDHNPTGTDRLQYPAIAVRILIDSSGKTYKQDVDFTLQEGQIKWTGSNRPGYDKDTGRGRVCSVRYIYRPYYYVREVGHDIRIRPSIDQDTGIVSSKGSGPMCSIQREYVFVNSRNADDSDITQQLDNMDTDNTGPR
jgi:hypothetical protein